MPIKHGRQSRLGLSAQHSSSGGSAHTASAPADRDPHLLITVLEPGMTADLSGGAAVESDGGQRTLTKSKGVYP